MLVIKIFAKCLASLESWCLLRSLLGKVVDLYNLRTGNINPHVFFLYPYVCALTNADVKRERHGYINAS